MKTKLFLVTLATLSNLFFVLEGHAMDITATTSGNWGDPTIWSSGTVPGTNDDADIPAGIDVTVTNNASIQYIYDGGTVTMGTNSTLDVLTDSSIAATITLDTSASSNTVIYSGNAYFTLPQNYYNLVLNGLGNFWNGANGGVPITIAGNMTLAGTAGVAEGDDFTIEGNLIMGGNGSSNITWDCSVANLTVKGNTIIGSGAKLTDGDGAFGSDVFNNLTVNQGGTLYLLDSTNWVVNGSLTNNVGTISGIAYASIYFDGTGSIAGTTAVTLPTLTINGTYTIGTTINLTTNTPTLNGTLVFDIANPQQIILAPDAGSGPTLYYNGNLDVINTGPAPVYDATYQFFNAQSFGGGFANTSFPPLTGSLSWVNNLAANGSIAITGGSTGTPAIIPTQQSGGQLTLSWNSATYPGFHVQVQTNSAGIGSNWTDVAGGNVSPFIVTINPTSPPVFFRLSNQ